MTSIFHNLSVITQIDIQQVDKRVYQINAASDQQRWRRTNSGTLPFCCSMSNQSSSSKPCSASGSHDRKRPSPPIRQLTQAKQRKTSSVQQQQQQRHIDQADQSGEALVVGGADRQLRDLTDFFPEVPEGRRLTRALARRLEAEEHKHDLQPIQSNIDRQESAETARGGSQQQTATSSSPTTERLQEYDNEKEEEEDEDEEEVAGPSTSNRTPIGVPKTRRTRATAAASSSNKKRTTSLKRATLADSAARLSAATAAAASPSADVNTGICLSISRCDGNNRVFPEQNTQPPPPHRHQQAANVAADMATHAFGQFELSNHEIDAAQQRIALPRSQAAQAASTFLGTLVPRMQHLLGGAHAHQNSRVMTIMEGLRSSNEIRQSEAATELAEMLLLGNEESLPNLPLKELVQALMLLLQKEHNFELMLTAARCITNLLEALPRALPIVLDTVPLLLEKLKRIECIDVAEQALTALEVLSRRNGKTIMSAGGIAATISHIDFFSVPSQRLAFQIAANCAMFVTANDFPQVRDSLPELIQRLLVDDKRCLESVCTVFARLVDALRGHPDKLREIAGANYALFTNVQQLLLVLPPAIGSATFQLLIRMLRHMCTKCSDLAVALAEMDFARTLRILIVGTDKSDSVDFELLNRPPQQLQELVFLAGELLPMLPSDGIFEIDAIMCKSQSASVLDMPQAQWFWKDDNNFWQAYSNFDSRVLELAVQANEREVSLHMLGQVYRIDIERLIQINEMTGNARQVQRRAITHQTPKSQKQTNSEQDKRKELLNTNKALIDNIVKLLFPILVEIDGSSSGAAIRYESLRVMLRMVHPISPQLLQEVLNQLPLAGHLASALASPRSKDLCNVASALQLVHLVTEKLPHIYGSLFRREGVAHEIEKLTKLQTESSPSPMISSKSTPNTESQLQSQFMPSRIQKHSRHRAASTTELQLDDTLIPKKVSRGGVRFLSAAATAGQPALGAGHGVGDQASASTHHPFSAPVAAAPSHHHKSTRRHPSPHASAESTAAATRSTVTAVESSLTNDVAASSPTKKDAARKKTSSSTFLHALRLPNWRLPGSSSTGAGSSSTNSASIDMQQQQASSSRAVAVAAAVASLGAGNNNPTPPAHYVAGLMHGMRPMPAGYNIPLNTAGMLSTHQKEKLRIWIKREAQYLMDTYFTVQQEMSKSPDSLLERMSEFSTALLTVGEDVGSKPLLELKSIFLNNDISAFELNHSGLIGSFTAYLTSETLQPACKLRLKRFAAVFMGLTPDNLRPCDSDNTWLVFELLIQKLLASVAQFEQFQVKVSDLGGMLASGGSLRGASALRFFQSHQIRCALKRHPSCKELREWRHGHGSIKVDPFTSISAIERYLLDRGIGFPRQQGADDSSGDDDATSDDDEVEGGADGSMASGGQQRRIDILINEHKLPGHMSILQAIRQYVITQPHSGDVDHIALAASIWVNTHNLWYRAASPDDEPVDASSTSDAAVAMMSSSTIASGKSKKSPSGREKKIKVDDRLWIGNICATFIGKFVCLEGRVADRHCPLTSYLSASLSTELDDACTPSLILLRILYGLNRYWWTLFDDEEIPPTTHAPLLPPTAFHSTKLTAKIGRQLGDFLTVATQQIPKWINDLIWAVPFVVPFATRRNFLYCTAFGRDRALMHLVNQTDGGQSDGETGRLTPRLERRKVSIRREELLRQAEDTMQQLGSSRAMLEVGFEGEAGTGFGPTLEFYSTVSRELQKYALKLWHGDKLLVSSDHSGGVNVECVWSHSGLYPTTIGVSNSGNAKQREARIKKFEFIGRLMAQALIDARMLDMPLNPIFFKWLLGEEKSFSLCDLEILDKNLYQSLKSLMSMSPADDFDSLEVYFTLPGDDSFELIKGGKDKMVNKSNVRQYAELVSYWRLIEGVKRDMEAVRRGLESIIDLKQLALFTAEEMDELFCGCSESANGQKTWERAALQQALKPDHGYSHESQQIKWLIDMLASFSIEQQRKFLQFVTGSPKLPVGGFRSLNPSLTVVKKSGTYGNCDDELPSAMTCYNYLKIPAYSSYAVFVERFELALRFIYSFHLT